MRIYIKTGESEELVPFDYQRKLVGVLHKWIGKQNKLHDQTSLYSFSFLKGGRVTKNGFDFPDGASFFISCYDGAVLKRIVSAIFDDRTLFCGLSVQDISIEPEVDVSGRSLFLVASPVLVKGKQGDTKHYTYENQEAGEMLVQTIAEKMVKAGLAVDETLKIKFDLSCSTKQIKLIDYKGVKNRVSMCPVLIEGRSETKAFVRCVGLGNSTGIGFGAVY